MRSGNIVSLEIDRHLSMHRKANHWHAEISVPGETVKNGVALFSRLTAETAALIREWIDVYRPALLPQDNATSRYLFPNQVGGHLAVGLATQSFKDLAARHGGLDLTPHGMRSFIGKLMLDDSPDAHPIVQELLGHRRLETTIKYYAPIQPIKARQRYQEILVRKRHSK